MITLCTQLEVPNVDGLRVFQLLILIYRYYAKI